MLQVEQSLKHSTYSHPWSPKLTFSYINWLGTKSTTNDFLQRTTISIAISGSDNVSDSSGFETWLWFFKYK